MNARSTSGSVNSPMVRLFIGQDTVSKDAALAQLKQEILPAASAFNLDTVYGRETGLKKLQELLLFFPFDNNPRLVIVRNAHELKDDAKEFLLKYIKAPHERLVLVIDVERNVARDPFLEGLKSGAKTVYFKEERPVTVFDLARAIEIRDGRESLVVLNRLLFEGEKPERLLGGLRASWQKRVVDPRELERRLRLLLECDVNIKTGRLKPALVLERLVIGLCGLRKPD